MPHHRFGLKVPTRGIVLELKHKLAALLQQEATDSLTTTRELYAVLPENMIVVEVYNHRVLRHFHDNKAISSIRDNDLIYVYEVFLIVMQYLKSSNEVGIR